MCSISGWISGQPLPASTASRLASALLYYGSSRGSQSAGIAYGNRVHKAAVSPSTLINSAAFDALFDDPALTCLCHTRQPTSGGRDDTDAQPFVSPDGSVMTIHNGMISNCPSLMKKYNLTKAHSQVDSELFCSFIASHGGALLPSFIKAALGCASVAALDRGTLYLVRENNPLVSVQFHLHDKTPILVFASTREILTDALKYVWLLPTNIWPTTIDERQLYIAHADGLEASGDSWGFQPYSKVSDHRSYSNYRHGWPTDTDDGPALPANYHGSYPRVVQPSFPPTKPRDVLTRKERRRLDRLLSEKALSQNPKEAKP